MDLEKAPDHLAILSRLQELKKLQELQTQRLRNTASDGGGGDDSPKLFDRSRIAERDLIDGVSFMEEKENTRSADGKTVKRPFLRKGEGMTRFNMCSEDIGIKNRKLPWSKKQDKRDPSKNKKPLKNKTGAVKIVKPQTNNIELEKKVIDESSRSDIAEPLTPKIVESLRSSIIDSPRPETPKKKSDESPGQKITWAKLLTQEQDSYLCQLKQSSYYKNYSESPHKQFETSSTYDSPSKLSDSTISFRENADQNLFELLEQKLLNSSITSNNSFINKLLTNGKLEPCPNEENESQWTDEESCDETTETDETCRFVSECEPSVRSTASQTDENKEIFKTDEMLKQKLLEVEDEIVNFQNESARIASEKSTLEAERQEFLTTKADFEKTMYEDRVLSEYQIVEEREKLAKLRVTLEQQIRDAKNKSMRKERQEIAQLKKQIESAAEENRNKEAKSGAAIARLRNQIKTLEKENSELKSKNEKVAIENKRLQQSNVRTRRLTNIKSLAELNKSLTKSLPDADQELFVGDDIPQAILEKKTKSKERKKYTQTHSTYEKYFSKRDTKTIDLFESSDEELPQQPETEQIPEPEKPCSVRSLNLQDIYTKFDRLSRDHSSTDASTSSFASKLLRSENNREDGSKVTEYTNGNIKIVSPDESHVKFFYFNGDVKETFMDDGRIKYFYAQTKTYHTTYKDGLQVLQFADGQLEHRHPDGSSKVHLPNGSVRFMPAPDTSNLKEEWTFPDGTAVSIDLDGEQVIRFPNGQIEVHNEEHKRREFPDGTVKIVYADGMTETRFASGRVRVKDKTGKLVIDSSDNVPESEISKAGF